MSFDLGVFDGSKAPRSKDEFSTWFQKKAEWELSRKYNSPDAMTARLRSWFGEAKANYPNADYAIGTDLVCAEFDWAVADEAERFFRESARRHDVGFYNPQSDTVIYPGAERFKLSSNTRDIEEPTRDDVWDILSERDGFIVLERGDGFMQAAWSEVAGYHVEAQPPDVPNSGMPKFYKDVASLDEVADLFYIWLDTGKMPDFSDWREYDKDPPPISPKDARANAAVKWLAVVVGLAVIIGIIAYIARDFLR